MSEFRYQQGYVAASGLQPRRQVSGAAASLKSIARRFQSINGNTKTSQNTEIIPPEEMTPFVVYNSSGVAPSTRIELQPQREPKYSGSMSQILRADMVQLKAGSRGTKFQAQLVVCKEFLDYGERGTGEEASIAAKAYVTAHECIVPYLGTARFAYEDPTKFKQWIVMPDMVLGNLQDWVENKANDIDADNANTCRQLVEDVLSGLVHLHNLDIVHGDIKTDNIFVWDQSASSGRQLRGKIADFGLARYSTLPKPEGEGTKPIIRLKGDPVFLAVEHFDTPPMLGFISDDGDEAAASENRGPGNMSKQKPTDIWGFAMIMLHVYSGKRPWPGLNEERIAKLTLQGCRPQYPGSDAFHRGLDFIRWRIAQDCWQHIPSHRPTAAEILHIWNDPHSRQVGSNLVPELIGDSGSGLLDMTRCTKYYLSVSPTLSPGYESITAECRAHPNASGCVYVDLVRPSGQASVDKSGWYQPFRDEVARWRRLRHENLLPLFGVCFVKELQQWHAVVPRYDPFEDWHEGVVRRRKHLSKTLAPWLKLILDVANALNFLHMQVPPITHGDLILDNVYIPHWMTSAVETPTTVHACLGGFRTVSINENTSQDVKAWAELARTVLELGQANVSPSTPIPPILEQLINLCSTETITIFVGAVRPLSAILGQKRR